MALEMLRALREKRDEEERAKNAPKTLTEKEMIMKERSDKSTFRRALNEAIEDSNEIRKAIAHRRMEVGRLCVGSWS